MNEYYSGTKPNKVWEFFACMYVCMCVWVEKWGGKSIVPSEFYPHKLHD